MGSDKKKRTKHKKEKKHKKRKRVSSSSSSSEVEWVEKKTSNKTDYSTIKIQKREEWLSLPEKCFSSSYSRDKRKHSVHQQKLEREKKVYDPRTSSKELNILWKTGDYQSNLSSDKMSPSKSNECSNYNITTGSLDHGVNINNDAGKEDILNNDKNHVEEVEVDTTTDINELGAKIIKAEILGNTHLVSKLKNELEQIQKHNSKENSKQENILLTHTNSRGVSVPFESKIETYEPPHKYKKQKKFSYVSGERTQYYPDDDKYSLQQLFKTEKFNVTEEGNREFLKAVTKTKQNDNLEEVFLEEISKKKSAEKVNKKNKEKAINEYHKISENINKCKYCVHSEKWFKHLIISMGENVYLSLTPFEPLTDGHCLIIPVRHTSCITQFDENEWLELMNLRRKVTSMFTSLNKSVVFFEHATGLNYFSHAVLECVPVPKKSGDLAPMYFKKAIDESEGEWTHNKKLISLAGRNIRKSVPKGLPYFSVSFGMEEGFAHIIEDKKLFPINFAQEIIAGMLDISPSKWRKPKYQNFKEDCGRVKLFSEKWTNFNC